MSKPCIWCGKLPEDHADSSWYEPPMETIVLYDPSVTMTPYEYEEPNVFSARPWSDRLRRVFSDTVQWRLIALAADIVVLGIFLGNWKLVTAAGALLFGLKTALFILWRTWREARLED